MVRQREFDPGAALTGAMQVFASRGYSKTSIDDVVKATGVSRYGIYGTFGNKRELFEQALEKYTEHMGKAAFLRLLQPDATLDHIRNTYTDRLDHMYECEDQTTGCLVIFTAMELAPGDKDIELVLNGLLMRMSHAYSTGLQHALEKGEIKEDLDLEKMGQFLTGAFFGMSVMSRCGFTRESMQAFIDSTIAAVAR
jgi:TetR/AcrR family transcriptional repressor of nem operon